MSNAQKRNLGRGLSALIPPKPNATASGPGLVSIALQDILPGDAQPRQVFDERALAELAESIKEHGVIQPIVVRKRSGQQYEIIAGERRWRAAQRAGLEKIQAIVTDAVEEKTLTLALVENIQRQDLNPIEEAEAYRRLNKQLGYSQAEIAKAVGKDRATVANALRLLKLPAPVRDQVLDGSLSMGHARALLSLDDDSAIIKASKQVRKAGLNVRQTEKLVADKKNPKKEKAPKAKRPARESDAERDVRMRLQRALGTRVELSNQDGKGSFTVYFSSYDELEQIMAAMNA